MDTIFALASGAPPAALAIIRISGPAAGTALAALTGHLPQARRATFTALRDSEGVPLDQGIVIWFPGPATATGEDLAELHLHGGRAVVVAVSQALQTFPSIRAAQPGEFTRRAFLNGRIDLAEAEGLADLLYAETELQRRVALTSAGGALSRSVEEWRQQVLSFSAQIEAVLDFDEEDDVEALSPIPATDIQALASDIGDQLAAPSAEAIREGFRVALAGPPNSGKSTLFNALVEDEAAITADIPGTTRDVLSRAVAIEGVPFLFVDMAGLRIAASDPIEAIGVARAEAEIAKADLVLWLGTEGLGPEGCWEIEAQCDRPHRQGKRAPRLRISAVTGENVENLRKALVAQAKAALPKPGEFALSSRQRHLLREACERLVEASIESDPLCLAEGLRSVRHSFDQLTGRASTQDVLDTLFGRFCIGK